jgi:hypothetical protein
MGNADGTVPVPRPVGRRWSENRQQLLLQAAGLARKAAPQATDPQDQGVDVALAMETAFEVSPEGGGVAAGAGPRTGGAG